MKRYINFTFESNFENFLNCPDMNVSGMRRFAASPMAVTILDRTQLARRSSTQFKPKHFIIATGVNHCPDEWAGSPLAYNNTCKSAFSFLTETQLINLRFGRSMLLFDQSLEGYQTTWLWEYFHSECTEYNINPRSIVYTSGNLLGKKQYTKWADDNNIVDRMTVLPYAHFEADMYNRGIWSGINLSVDKHLKYKKEHNIKTYNCLQKRLRNHRTWFYLKLLDAGLLSDGLVSMNKFSENSFLEGKWLTNEEVERANKTLPSLIYGKNNNEKDFGFYMNRIHDNICLDTWFSVISEASFADINGQLFLSEKTFKPIVCYHPFIILGDKGSLKALRDMGYKTFNGFIDESYDELPTWERYDAIINEIKRINAIEDKAAWFESMRHILEHNYENLKKNSTRVNPVHKELEQAYKKYFKLGKYKNV